MCLLTNSIFENIIEPGYSNIENGGGAMPRAKFQTLTEQMFYVLLCLREECCGMDILDRVPAVTLGRVRPGWRAAGAATCSPTTGGRRWTGNTGASAPRRRTINWPLERG